MKNIELSDVKLKELPRGISIWTLLVAMLTLGHFFNNKWILMVSLITILLYFILININEKIKLLFFLIPWIYILKIELWNRTIFTYLTIILLITVIYESKLNFDKKKIISILLIIILILCQKLIISENITFEEINFIITLLTLGLMKKQHYKLFKWDDFAIAFVYGLFLSIISALVLNGLSNMEGFFRLNYAVKGEGIGLRFSALHMDPNGFGTQAIFGVMIGMILITQKEKIFKNNVSKMLSIMILIIFLSGFLSGSKAYFFTAILSVFLYIILLIFEGRALGSIKFIFLFLLSIFIGYQFGWVDPIIIRYMARFSNITDLGTFSSGRINILQKYFEIIMSNPWIIFVGTSLKEVKLSNAAHNTIVQAITRLGLISTLTIVFFLNTMYKSMIAVKENKIKNRNISWIRFMPLVVYMFMGLSLDLLFKNEFLYIVFLGIFTVASFKPLKDNILEKEG